MKINVVTDLDPSILERERSLITSHEWEYSQVPRMADIYVVYGLTRELDFPLKASPKIFIGVEPPEIAKYDLRVLSEYTVILAPEFPYLAELSNHRVASGLLNWSIGNSDHVTRLGSSRSIPSTTEILRMKSGNAVTMIVSSKRLTEFQRIRLQFAKYLSSRLARFQVYGRSVNPIDDKLSVLGPNHFHIAFENSRHPGYWTEKLADPLISLNQVFYVGDPKITKDFNLGCVTELPYWDFQSSLRVIQSSIDEPITREIIDERIAAREKILTKLNIHSVIESYLEEVSVLNSKIEAVNRLPAHYIATNTRIKWFFDSIRQRTYSGLG